MNSTELQQSANKIQKHLTSPVVPVIVAAGVLGGFIYMSFLLRPEYRGDALPYALALTAEIFVIMQGFLSFWTILSGRTDPRNFEYHRAQDGLYDTHLGKSAIRHLKNKDSSVTRTIPMYIHKRQINVDVFIPVYGEPLEEIRTTVLAARDMHGQHNTYILDDGKSDQVELMAEQVGVNYIRRPTNEHAKAGNINYALGQTKADF